MERRQVAVGNVNIDVIVWAESIPPPDGSVKAERIVHTLGGGAVNYSVATARMGHRVSLVGAVTRVFERMGFGEWLGAQGVDTSLLTHVEGDPGTTVVLNIAGEARRIISYRGANLLLEPRHVIAALTQLEKEPHLTHLASVRAEIAEAFFEARERLGWRTLASMDPGSETRSLGRRVEAMVEQLDVLLMNEGEYTMALTLSPRELVSRHPHLTLVLKQGRRGATVYWKDGVARALPPRVDVVDTTGAGDAFNAAFNSCMLERMDPRECLVIGVAAGTLKATRLGSTSSPTRGEVEEFAPRVMLE